MIKIRSKILSFSFIAVFSTIFLISLGIIINYFHPFSSVQFEEIIILFAGIAALLSFLFILCCLV